MIDFELIGRPAGIPFYFQRLPGNRVSIRLAFFVGSMDDAEAGGDGAAHWFEHVPFKGTVGYPDGEDQIYGPIIRRAGILNAYTSQSKTVYHAIVPKRIWKHALDIVTDLAGQPLLTDEGIEIERKVIYNEITDARANIGQRIWQEILSKLWPGHPIGHHVLGTQESLAAIAPETIRIAHQRLYDRSRAVLIISGDIDPSLVLFEAKQQLEKIPDHGLSERRGAIAYGELSLWKARVEEWQTEFEASLVAMAWPIGEATRSSALGRTWLQKWLGSIFVAGSLCSPLLRILRRERQLVYGAGATNFFPSLDGGTFFITALTKSREDVPAVIQGLRDVVTSDQIRSKDRYDYLVDDILGSRDMEVPDAHDHTNTLLSRFLANGTEPPNDEEWYAGLLDVSHEKVLEALNELTPEKACTLILNGTK